MTEASSYWLHQPSKDAIGYLSDFHDSSSVWYNSPFRQAWVRNFVAYYSPVLVPGSWDTSLVFQGMQGELVRFFTPKARTLIRNLVTLTTKQPLAFQAMAETDGSDIIQDLKKGNAYIEQTIDNEECNLKGEELTEIALVTGGAFLRTVWRTDKGQPYTRNEDGSIVYTGSCEISVESPFNVFYDASIPDWKKLTWCEVRTKKNRWDLIAQHPDLKDAILGLPSVSDVMGPDNWFYQRGRDEDLVYIYECYARPCPALPQGRMIVYGDDKTVLYDDKNPYEGIPVEPMMPEKVMCTGIGYPIFTNLIAPQEMYDNSLSAWATNEAAFAVQSVTIPRGSGINVNTIGGMRFVEFTPQNVPGGGKPEPMQLNATSSSTKEFSKVLEEVLNDLSQINGALRGSPPPGITSGVALATLSTNALEFISGIVKSYYACWKNSMTHVVNQYKTFGTVPQNVQFSGANNQTFMSKVSGQDLTKISGIKILVTNPLMQTIAGRLEIGEKLLEMPREIWPQYVSILEGRPLQDIYKGDLSEEDLINGENELLSKGQMVPALKLDDHARHIQAHAGMLNDPNVRLNSPYVEAILAHIQQHEFLAQTTDPFLLAMVRTGKMPNMPPPPPPNGGNGPPSQGVPNTVAEPANHTAKPAKDLLNRRGEP